ncbi:MAG: polynucleotide adenylyltransferase PcnB, partial [Pseudomonadota bacterium]
RRFRAAYDFFVLRAETGDANPEFAGFWTDAQLIPVEERPAAFGVSANAGSSSPKKRRRRRRKKPT